MAVGRKSDRQIIFLVRFWIAVTANSWILNAPQKVSVE
jgi:hypothetical protein